MKQPKIFVFVLCVLGSFSSVAQENVDSARLLKTVVITQSRLNDYVIAAYELPLDSSVLALSSNGSLTDLLRKHGLGHIRSYGPGGLATPSFRGTGSSHTAVLWNGINLVSPLSGQLDLSIVPATLFDDASIQTGGSTSLSGNGSIGANINLTNTLNFNEGLRASTSTHIGSFSNSYTDVSLQFSNQKFGSSTKIFRNTSVNDFKFTNTNIFPAEIQSREHSAFHQQGVLQQLHWQSARIGILSVKLWYQKSKHEIPNPTTVFRPSQAIEENEFHRVLAGWNFNKEKVGFTYQSAFINQGLKYTDPLIDVRSQGRYSSIVQNLETSFDPNDHSQLTTGVHYTWEKGEVDEFGQNSPIRNRFALFSAYKVDIQKWKLAFSLREEFVNGSSTPVAPSVSAKYFVSPAIEIFTNVSRNYRIPTFNDLHWKGSGARGNPALRPEHALGGEAGASFGNSLVSSKAIVFSNHVDNWILWYPGSDQAWTPQNIKKVWARGVESQITIAKKIRQITSRLVGQYSFTRSTNEDVYANGNQNERGKQLILTPQHEGSVTAVAEWKKYSVRVVNAFTGQQFNDSDNSPYNIVPAYLITNVWISKQISRERFEVAITAEINNLFNVAYQARPGYPLPGINYKAGVQLSFNKPNRNRI